MPTWRSRTLTDEQWRLLTTGTDELGRRILDEYGLHVQFHSHADSHVGYQPEIERFLEATNPDYVNLCLDTGHVAYYGGDCVELITRYPERIGYVHLKQVDPVIVKQVAGRGPHLPRGRTRGAMIEPPPACPTWRRCWTRSAASDATSKRIIEQDMYPCSPTAAADRQRTNTYLASCSGARSRSASGSNETVEAHPPPQGQSMTPTAPRTTTMATTLHHWADGATFEGRAAAFSDVTNPATGEVTAQLALASEADVDDGRGRGRRGLPGVAGHLAGQADPGAVRVPRAAERPQGGAGGDHHLRARQGALRRAR